MGRQHQGNGQAQSSPSLQRAMENRGKMVETGCEIICGAPTTLAVYWIDDDDDDDDDDVQWFTSLVF